MVRRLSRENGLATGRVDLAGRERNLADIEIPVLVGYGTHDHVTPPASVTPLGDVLRSDDIEIAAVKAGHIGLLVGKSAKKQTLPTIAAWLQARELAN